MTTRQFARQTGEPKVPVDEAVSVRIADGEEPSHPLLFADGLGFTAV